MYVDQGFQAGNIDAVRSKRMVCVVKAGEIRAKAFQIMFAKDGSLFVSFPYFRHRTGILSSSLIPADGRQETTIDLQNGGKVTSHLVKYTHHRDGRAHFSQDGKIFTAIKRQSIALETQHGHMFSLLIQGVTGLEQADPAKDIGASEERAIIDFEVESPEAIKFIGRWYDVNRMRFSNPVVSIGPIVPLFEPGAPALRGCMVASPHVNTKHVLIVSCQAIPKLGSEPEKFMFYGGFDPGDTMRDSTKEAGFLAFTYPISDARACSHYTQGFDDKCE
jgi:hypothetical protein